MNTNLMEKNPSHAIVETEPTVNLTGQFQTQHERIIALKVAITDSFWEIGARLKLIQDDKLYPAGGYATFEEYIASPEIALDRSTVYDWIGIVETFTALNVGPSDIQDIEWSKLRMLRPVIREHPEELHEWLSKGRSLSRSDIRKELLVYRGREQGREPEELFIEGFSAIRALLNSAQQALEVGDLLRAAQRLERAGAAVQEILTQLNQRRAA